MTTLEGHLERITYYSEETRYTIARLNTGRSAKLVTIVGFSAGVAPGEGLRLEGAWETHPKYGPQFKFETLEVTLPASLEGIRKYLASGIIKGIGPSLAAKLIACFGTRTLDVIEDEPHKLLEVEGIGPAKAEMIRSAWREHHTVREVMRFLQQLGLKTSYGSTLLKRYGQEALEIMRTEPYRLADDLPGIGFQIADRIAQKQGGAADAPQRIRACIFHVMQQFADDGHVFALTDQLSKRCRTLFQIEPDTAAAAVERLVEERELVRETPASPDQHPAIYLTSLHRAETGLAARLKALLSFPATPPDIDPQRISAEVQQKLAIALSSEQLHVLEEILAHRVAIITGGPGTGKTTLIRSINALFQALGRRVLLAAPTGRAARRLAQVTRCKAQTIHRLLGYNFRDNTFDKDQDDPLDTNVLIVDEASMIDTLLMFHLLKAVPLRAVLILVGDVFQLPAVGPGNVLGDMIASERIPAFYLNTIFRQDRESSIVVNAHQVRQGSAPRFDVLDTETGLGEFCFLEKHSPEAVVETIVALCTQVLPEHFGLDPLQELQILTPMHKGLAGTLNLNRVLQGALNPNPVMLQTPYGDYKIGDKVMHLKNNYQKEVFNGDIGTIQAIDQEKSELRVDYYGRTVAYDLMETVELSLAYAVSVHKSQGSEYPAVIVSLVTQHYPLLQRNLLYTAITRSERLVILVGNPKALAIALNNDKPAQRLTSLDHRLRERI